MQTKNTRQTQLQPAVFKVGYWNPSSANVINSKIFGTYEQATSFIGKVTQNGMIYTLMERKTSPGGAPGRDTWKLLDDGVGRYLSPLSKGWKYRKQIMYGTAGILLWRLIFK